MQLQTYVSTVRDGVQDAAALGDEQTQKVAGRLGRAVESSTRLALIRAVSDAAAEISTDLAPGSVEVRMAAGEPEFIVILPEQSTNPTVILPPPIADEESASGTGASVADDADDPDASGTSDAPDAQDGPQARISLRLPASVKDRVDRAADAAGVSTNTWLVEAIQVALEDDQQDLDGRSGRAGRAGRAGQGPEDWSGNWAGRWSPGGLGQVFGPDGPFGPDGVFGPEGILGNHDPSRPGRPGRQRPHGPGRGPGRRGRPGWGDEGRSGKIQGWVR